MVGLQPRRLVGGQRERGCVGLAEPEGRERPQDIPHLLHHRELIPAPQRRRVEPGPHVVLPLRTAERAPGLVGLGQRAAGHRRDDAQHLLVEDDDPVRLLEGRAEVLVQEHGRVPALPGAQEGSDHVGLHRPGTEQ